MRTPLLALLSLVLLVSPALALTVDEVVQLSRAGLTDDVLIAQIEADGPRLVPTDADLNRLRRENVSEAVIHALRGDTGGPRTNTTDALDPVDSAPAPSPAAVEEGPLAPGPGETLLVLRNEDRRTIAATVDAAAKIVEFHDGPGASLAPGQTRRMAVPYGVYAVRWRGEARTYRVSTRAGERTDLLLLTIDAPEVEGLRLRVLRNGRDFGSTTLRLAARPPALVEARPPRTTVLGPQPPVVIRETVVVPAPTPVYVDPYPHADCQTYVPVAPVHGYAVPYTYGTYSTSFHTIQHGPGHAHGAVYYENGCGR